MFEPGTLGNGTAHTGNFNVKMEMPKVEGLAPPLQEPLKTVAGDLQKELAKQVGDQEARNLWDKVNALVPTGRANVMVVFQPAQVVVRDTPFTKNTMAFETGSFYRGDVSPDAIRSVKVDLTNRTATLVGGNKVTMNQGQDTAGAYWRITGGALPPSIGVGAVSTTKLSDAQIVQNTYGVKATGADLTQVAYEQQVTTITGNTITTATVTMEQNPLVKAAVGTAELWLAGWGVKKVAAWGWATVAEKVGQEAPALVQAFRKAFEVATP